MYQELGISVGQIINPPVDCAFFEPSTRKPTADYVLTTLGTYGKEGNISIVKALADAGVKIKVFGDTSGTPASARGHSNIAFLGKVSDEKLVNLYSNALYTLFAFTHEPFGYIPVESMACGTPVLTYNRQGPLETVIDGKTGWLADSNKKMLTLGLNHWKKGYGNELRTTCRQRALMFDTDRILKQWNTIIEKKVTEMSD
jgi:glycosyltransferase involved in cell wall biosynthesis